MRCGYGMHRYNFEEVELMFDGLNWLRWQQYEKKGQHLKLCKSSSLKNGLLNGWQQKQQ
jgi:hypothetical protein